MARMIVNDFPDGLARGGRGSAPTPAFQIAMIAREFAAIDTTLRFSRQRTGNGPPPRTSPSQEPRQDIRVRQRAAGQWSGVTPGAGATCGA